uniref:GH18 domain-containing protein n=1 Tax=Anopheles dirus TaxID=7168 RepID=A0A182NJX7_9DIPT
MVHSTAGCLAWTYAITVFVALCGVSLVDSLPCGNQGSTQLAKIVCFITASNEHYDYESLRTGLCSHIVLIDLMGVGKDGCLEMLQTSSRSLNRFTRMKRRFRDVGDEAKFIVSIGGVAQKSCHFSGALKTVESRYALSDELISFVIKHGLDGVDIAWFYPAQFGGAESDRTNLVVFLCELHLRTKACAITLSLTVGVDPKDIELSYDVPRINECVDYVNLLTSDYHNPSAPTHISPLYGQGPRDRLNINYSVMSYIEAGLNPRKIIIMSSCYAYLYVSKINKEDDACSAKLRTVMRLSYLSTRELITRESLQTSWDDMRQVPYGTVTNGLTKKWLTYNDVESIKRKADYALHYQLGGMGLFSVDEDDYGGRGGCGRYPMLRAIVSVIYPELDCTEEDTEDIEHIICPHNGYLTDPVEPECYYMCQKGLDLQDCPKQCCPQGQTFSPVQNGCYLPVVMQSNAVTYNPAPQYQTIGPAPSNVCDPSNQYCQTQVQPYQPLLSVDTAPSKSCASQYDTLVSPTYMASPSTMSPMYVSIDEPMIQASNIVPQVVISPRSFEGHIPQGPQAAISLLNSPSQKETEPDVATDPPVLITPKPKYKTRASRNSRKRKSRSKSHAPSTAKTEISTVPSTTASTASSTIMETSSATTTMTSTSTNNPTEASETTAETTLPPVAKTTTPSTTSTAVSTTTTPSTTPTSSTTSSTVTVTTTLSTTVTPNVTFTDKTSTIPASSTPTTLSSTTLP